MTQPISVASVPLLDENGRFPDRYAPPSVATNAVIATNAAAAAQNSADDAADSASASQASAVLSEQHANDSENSAETSDGFRVLSATAASEAAQSKLDAESAKSQAQQIKDSIEADRGVPNGLATLDSTGRLPSSMLPLSALEYKGAWNASTNSPVLSDGTGSIGDMYTVSVAGSRNLGSGTLEFAVGDNVIHNGTKYEKIDNTDQVTSVAGKQGAVTLVKADVGLANVDNTSDLDKPISNATQTALNSTVNGGSVVGDNLVLTQISGGQVNAGNVRGPQGLMGEQIPTVSLTNVSGVLDLSGYVLPRVFNITLSGNVTSVLLPAHQSYGFVHELNIKQDATGGRTLTWPSGMKFPQGIKPSLSTAANAVDQFYLESTGTDYLGKVGGFAFA